MRPRDWLLLPATVVVAGGGTIWGGHNSYVAIRNRAPVELTCAAYVHDRPDAAWLRLTQCEPDFDHLGVETQTHTTRGTRSNGVARTSAVYVPLRPSEVSRAQPAHIVLVSEDETLLSLADHADDQTVDALASAVSTSVDGLIQSGLELNQRDRAELRGLNIRLADDFVMVRHGARPRPLWFALGELGLGLAAVNLLVRRYRRWSRRLPPEPPRATVVRA